jgi:hypothetical protein
MIRIEMITEGIEKEIDRLVKGPTQADFARFEAVLQNQFRATQAAVHVITRSLKSSGKLESKSTETSWEGEITYGGTSTGIHNPVDYAEYERERDGNHDFMAPAEALSHEYVAAIDAFLRG